MHLIKNFFFFNVNDEIVFECVLEWRPSSNYAEQQRQPEKDN